ncbi:hypothetical protein [uncultured Lactobacillus sp.]|uniref:hypothetical protein n=1 Tax=uncultured Lactobacillus sp. TaxID=153152 RepID=UPI0025F436F0|nr:hypothetical protein [uncultured Lactobacillus sp.]
MKIKNDKEIIVGKSFSTMYMGNREIPFFVSDITQLCFEPYEGTNYKYSVSINTALTKGDVQVLITKEQYEYLMEKLGANEDEN